MYPNCPEIIPKVHLYGHVVGTTLGTNVLHIIATALPVIAVPFRLALVIVVCCWLLLVKKSAQGREMRRTGSRVSHILKTLLYHYARVIIYYTHAMGQIIFFFLLGLTLLGSILTSCEGSGGSSTDPAYVDQQIFEACVDAYPDTWETRC